MRHIREVELSTEINLSDWKARLEQEVLNLKKRVLESENQKTCRHLKTSQELLCLSNDEKTGCDVLRTARLIKNNKAASLQCVWLIIFVVALTTVGIIEFLRAYENRKAEFKPEKKFKTIDYGNEGIELVYQMPYIYISFYCLFSENDGWGSISDINDTLEQLLQSQDNFDNKTLITYFRDFERVDEILPVEEVKAFHTGNYTDRGFLGNFMLKLKNPLPSIGYFEYMLEINMQTFALGQTIIVDGFWVSLSKTVNSMNLKDTNYISTVNYQNLSAISATIDYNEKITRTWSNGYNSYFTSSLGEYSETLRDNSDQDPETPPEETNEDVCLVTLLFRGDLRIEYWKEYVEYDYYEWLSGMGGTFSISSIFFFWGAYQIAVNFGDGFTMGILPEISFVYKNLESVHLLKKTSK